MVHVIPKRARAKVQDWKKKEKSCERVSEKRTTGSAFEIGRATWRIISFGLFAARRMIPRVRNDGIPKEVHPARIRQSVPVRCAGSKHAIAEGRKYSRRLSNPKAHGTAIYALTWKTRNHRERRILGPVCIYTSWEAGFPSSLSFVRKKQPPGMRRVIVGPRCHRFRRARETFKRIRGPSKPSVAL